MSTRLALAPLALLALAASGPIDARPKAPGAPPPASRDQAWSRHQALVDGSLYQGLSWRSIGPTVQGGRVVEIATIPGQPYGFYVAYATGGVWKSTNNGVSFEPLTD